MIRLLLQKGADPNIKDNNNNQATHMMKNYLPEMNELKDDINELLLVGIDN